MPIELGIRRMGTEPENIDFGTISNEQKLDDMLAAGIPCCILGTESSKSKH